MSSCWWRLHPGWGVDLNYNHCCHFEGRLPGFCPSMEIRAHGIHTRSQIVHNGWCGINPIVMLKLNPNSGPPCEHSKQNPTKHLAFKRNKRSTTFHSFYQFYQLIQHLFPFSELATWHQVHTKDLHRLRPPYVQESPPTLLPRREVGRHPMLPKVKSSFVFISLHQEFQPFHQEFHIPTQPFRTMFHKSLNGLFFLFNINVIPKSLSRLAI